MTGMLRGVLSRSAAMTGALLSLADVLLCTSALVLATHWYGLRGGAVFALFAVPVLLLRRLDDAQRLRRLRALGPAGAGSGRDRIVARLDAGLSSGAILGKSTACLVMAVDDLALLTDRFGPAAPAAIHRRTGDRIAGVLRDGDMVSALDDGRHAIAFAPTQRMNLESLIALSTRLRAAMAEPFSIDAMSVPVSVSVGFCLADRAPARSGTALLAAAECALDHALGQGAGSIRAYSEDVARAATTQESLRLSAGAALEQGEIVAWFQPQICTDTGTVSGFEALARWIHPTLGVLPPARFLPALAEAGQSRRLGEVMLFHALSALRGWDKAGFSVPTVSVNFSQDDLRDPLLADRLSWELDRFDIPPQRLNIEILETVMSETPDDVVARNIVALSRLGCGIDLDDFGTAHASISSLRRFAVSRLKIDRSLVAGVDSSADQRRIVSAILSMAGPLDLQVLAEGVETSGEHAMLAQLGCSHVQGYVIARPMPQDETLIWLAGRQQARQAAAGPGRRLG